jgi:RNA polymerase sigma factor (sigma-70 family)
MKPASASPATPPSDWVIQALDAHERPLLRYAKWLLGDVDAARDVVQETFLRLCKENPARLDGHMAAWLFTVCRNLALDHRQHSRRSAPIDDVEPQVCADLDERHDAQQALKQVLAIVDTLPPNQREVVSLKFQGDLSYKEISAVTGLSVSNVGFLLHTAVRAIRNQLAPATAPGAGHDYSTHQSERPAVDRLRTRRARG